MKPGERQPNAGLTLSLHGPNVTIEDAIRASTVTQELLAHLARAKGAEVAFEIVSIQFQCDGCGLTRPDRPGPDDGWTYRDGDDLCPVCSRQPDDEERP